MRVHRPNAFSVRAFFIFKYSLTILLQIKENNMITQISKLEVGRVDFYAMVDTVRDKKNMQFVNIVGLVTMICDKKNNSNIIENLS